MSQTELTSSQRAARVKLMIFDVDGVLTDGRLYYGADGEMLKTFNTLDGHGIKLLAAVGIACAIITGRKSGIVETRARELGIAHVYQGVHDKTVAFAELLATTGLEAAACGYMGDDWPDLPVMLRVGFATAPAGAHPEVIARAHWVAEAKGGRGAVREVCDTLLRAGHHYDALLAAACEG
jgi:3-deoxy-D-manno-octulosonate 8-phosphate phosphatase (KDO 8-P phosphatase)